MLFQQLVAGRNHACEVCRLMLLPIFCQSNGQYNVVIVCNRGMLGQPCGLDSRPLSVRFRDRQKVLVYMYMYVHFT